MAGISTATFELIVPLPRQNTKDAPIIAIA